MKKIKLKQNREISVLRRHLWIFSGALDSNLKDLKNGDIVEVASNQDKFLAVGYYMDSDIAIRILSFNKVEIDSNFFYSKFKDAFEYRKGILSISSKNNVFRLIHGEGDGIPGLIIDVYGDIIVVQTHNHGIDLQIDKITEALKLLFAQVEVKKLLGVEDVKINIKQVKSSQKNSEESETLLKSEEVLNPEISDAEKHCIEQHCGEFKFENNLQFFIDWKNGQKTGFFIDQRENRELIGKLSKNKSVLDAFCYAGGFSTYAISGGAKEVVSIDASKYAIELTNKNIKQNFAEYNNHTALSVDCFDYLEAPDREFDLIILDPPAFAKHKNAVQRAMRGYEMINSQAIKIIKSGGIIATFSCSQLVDKEMFREMIAKAVRRVGREVKIIKELGQAVCHPVNPCHVEGEYLKGLLLWVG